MRAKATSNATEDRRISAVAMLVLAALAGCVTDPVTGKKRYSLVDWTPEEERALGREFAPNIESQFDAVYPDADANRVLGERVADMVELSPRREDFDFHFKILNSSIPNAFALPGGYVYITRGLLQELETEAQFISVLGHELGHVEHRHAMLNRSQGALLGLPARPLGAVARRLPVGGGVAGLAAGLVAAPSALLGLKFSRSQELEADRRGVYFSAEMGYDPRDAIRTFELFARMEAESGGGASEFAIFRTHPPDRERVREIQRTVARDYPRIETLPASSFRRNDEGFDAALARLRERAPAYALYDAALAALVAGGADRSEGVPPGVSEKLAEARRIHPDEPLFLILEGEIALLGEDAEGARARFAEAVELYARHAPGDGHWKPHVYLGLFDLEAGDVAGALAHLRRSAELFPMNGEVQFFLGLAHEAAGESGAAIAAYRRAVESTHPESEAHRRARERLRVLE